MLKEFLTVIILLMGLQCNLSAQAVEGPAGVSHSTIVDIEQAGMQIFILDRAASRATDALMGIRGFKRDRRVKGWITEPVADGVKVSFVGSKGKGLPSVLYRATISSEGELVASAEALKGPVPLSEEQLRQFQARSVGLENIEAPCSKTYNTVVLPRDAPDSNWVVYALPGTKKRGEFLIGGSYRFEVNPEGNAVISSRGYAKTCVALTSQANLVAFMSSHLLDPNPTEIHVFVNLLSKISIYLITVDNRAMWKVEQGKIEFLKIMEEKN